MAIEADGRSATPKASAAARRPLGRDAGSALHRAAGAGLVVCALLAALLAAGCVTNDGVSRVVEVGPGQFNSVVLQSKQPVLVNFYKAG